MIKLELKSKKVMNDSLALDIGSSYIAIAVKKGNVFEKVFYKPHRGSYLEILKEKNISLEKSYLTGINSYAYGGLHPFFVLSKYSMRYPKIRHILYVGAGSYLIINLDEEGRYIGHISNSTCASGTGAFLDLQALRLGYSVEELGEIGLFAKVKPSISTRCSVFAKTDLIHLQQEGFTKQEIAAGLCYSMADNIIHALFKGKEPEGNILLTGGVFQNKTFQQAFKKKLGTVDIIFEEPHFALAFGLLYLAEEGFIKKAGEKHFFSILDSEKFSLKLEPLKIKNSDYPDFDAYLTKKDNLENEITFYNEKLENFCNVYMGIDIGSTSTKICITNTDGIPLLSIYRKTSSDPIEAVKKIFKSLINIEKEKDIKFNFLGVATTGSGRNLIGKIIGADMIINEISAHAKAAVYIDKDVDTIIEIGGQDSKFTRLKDGIVYYAVMNYVCAAGTGSFIEEQAEKLGIPIWDFSKYAEGKTPPAISDRCTVFMEKDIDLLIAKGVNKNDIAAAVLNSVRDNYLNKVVGNVTLGEHIYFQGATARNRALVASFEQRLSKTITVSPYCHVTGALGAALYLKEKNIIKSNFTGLSFSDKNTEIHKEECLLCNNKCILSIINTDAHVVAWGMKCGRDYEDKKPKKKQQNFCIEERGRDIKVERKNFKESFQVPYVLANTEKIDFIKAFLENLHIEPVIVKPDKDAYLRGKQYARYEICAPCVIVFGAVANLKKELPLFMPQFLRLPIHKNISHCHLCPLSQAMPSILKSMFDNKKIIMPKFINPQENTYKIDDIYECLKPFINVSRDDIKEALKAAEKTIDEKEKKRYEMGQNFLANIADDRPTILMLGRPYIIYNERLNHNTIESIQSYGIDVINIDFLPVDFNFIERKFPHVYWNYGQVLLSSLKYISQYRTLFPVYLSCFSCGPDSFLLNYFYREMQSLGKPYLSIQLDGHSAATGYITRIEAALDSFYNFLEFGKMGTLAPYVYKENESRISKNKVYIPPMQTEGAELFAASFKRFGINGEALEESTETFTEGLKHSIGHECSPFHSTLGALLNKLKTNKNDGGKENYSFFMPSGNGPCRFGQYGVLQGIIANELGLNVNIISPSGENAYSGLPSKLRRLLFDAVIMNDILRKIVMHLRPHELNKGEFDQVYEKLKDKLSKSISSGYDYEKVFFESVERLSKIPIAYTKKPLVGIVGEIYVRNNAFLNDNLIETIELLGGESVISSVLEWFFYTLAIEKHELQYYKGMNKVKKKLEIILKNKFYRNREEFFYSEAKKYCPFLYEPSIEEVLEKGEKYLPIEFYGEAILTIGRAVLFFEKENVDAIVNASPTFCMPGTISSYLLKDIENIFKKPVISLFYDKTGSPNLELIPYMEILKDYSL